MTGDFTRRAALIAGFSSLGSALVAQPLERSLRPQARPNVFIGTRPVSRPTIADSIARAELGGTVGFVVRDLDSGAVLANVAGEVQLPPASVTKSITALYAMEALGYDYRFVTKAYTDGDVVDGVLEGDLILAGGGDPQLSTDDLIALRDSLLSSGIQKVAGRFLVWGGGIDRIAEIEPSQMDHLDYNPSVGGLNLNFNRVHFEWKRQGASYRVQMDARGRTEVPLVSMSQMVVEDRGAPVFAYEDGGGIDKWSVARSALNGGGSRWLPVRYPALYTGDVFRSLCKAKGLELAVPILAERAPSGQVVAIHEGPQLPIVMRRMLNKSTNLTAEAAGLTASAVRSGQRRGLRTSAFQMSAWARQRAGGSMRFDDHSGLSDQTRVSAGDMVDLLAAEAVQGTLYPVLKEMPLLDDKGRPSAAYPAEIRAKTGTLNFVTTLAGYIRTDNQRNLAFAFFAADLERREASKASLAELPAGAASYNTRARRLQQSLLKQVVRMVTI